MTTSICWHHSIYFSFLHCYHFLVFTRILILNFYLHRLLWRNHIHQIPCGAKPVVAVIPSPPALFIHDPQDQRLSTLLTRKGDGLGQLIPAVFSILNQKHISPLFTFITPTNSLYITKFIFVKATSRVCQDRRCLVRACSHKDTCGLGIILRQQNMSM